MHRNVCPVIEDESFRFDVETLPDFVWGCFAESAFSYDMRRHFHGLVVEGLQCGIEKSHRASQLDVKRASDIRAKIPQVTTEFDRIEKALPVAGVGYSTIDQELTDYAKDTHLQVAEKKFQEKDIPGRNLSEVIIESTVVGDYSGIVRFLNHLQRSKNTYIVDTLQVDTASSGQGPAGTLKIGLKILTYFRKA